MCYSRGAACSCASGEKSVGEGDEAHEEPGGALHRNRNVPPMEKRVAADKKTAHGELLDITPTMSSLIEVQCVTMEKQTAHAPVEKRVLADEKCAHEEAQKTLHRNVPPVENSVLADNKAAHEEPSDIAPTMTSLIGVQCVTVGELPARAPVKKRVLADDKTTHEEVEEAVHHNVPVVEKRVLADEMTPMKS